MYALGGPATIDLLKEKYPHPKINENSFHEVYSKGYLKRAQKTLGLTDLWVSYCWGFSSQREKAHKEYIRKKLPLLKGLGLKTYGYVQGLNAVTEDFKSQDIFCVSSSGVLLPYSKNRHLICSNKDQARDLLLARIEDATKEDFDNIYVDNIMFGISPLNVSVQGITSFGCHCKDCKKEFKRTYTYDLPKGNLIDKKVIRDFLNFREKTTTKIVSEMSMIAHGAGKGFGVNLYDPFFHDPLIFFGYSFDSIRKYLDYYLFENHGIQKDGSVDNTHLVPLIQKTAKPVFVISYKDGIGIDGQYPQETVDAIFSEGTSLGYSPCLKTSEYKTNGVWHTLDINSVKAPAKNSDKDLLGEISENQFTALKQGRHSDVFARAINRFYPNVMNFLYHNHALNDFLHRAKLYSMVVRKKRNYDLSYWLGENSLN